MRLGRRTSTALAGKRERYFLWFVSRAQSRRHTVLELPWIVPQGLQSEVLDVFADDSQGVLAMPATAKSLSRVLSVGLN
jgi:hypothetical protein